MTNQGGLVGGIDSHKDTIHVAVITELGVAVEDREFPTTITGYRDATNWLAGHGPVTVVGVEGTSSYGAGIAAALLDRGVRVVEVNRTRPAERRRQGKSDQLDAYRAARAVLAGEATTDPKRASIEPLRALMIARRSAVKAQQAAWRQIGALLINAPAKWVSSTSVAPRVVVNVGSGGALRGFHHRGVSLARPLTFGCMAVLSQGWTAEGDEWQLIVRDRPGMNGSVTSTSIRVVSAAGRVSQGGYAERSLSPGESFDWSGGRDDESGPNQVILRFTRDVASVRVLLSDGRLEQPVVVDHPVHENARVAGLVFPRALDIASVELLDSDGRIIGAEKDGLSFGRPGPPR